MSQRSTTNDWESDREDAPSTSRPVRMRAAKKRPPRVRKTRRKRVTANGIHRRANKRTNW